MPFVPLTSPMAHAYHGTSQATGGSGRQRFWLVSAVCGSRRFAADLHRLQPRGSIKGSIVCRQLVRRTGRDEAGLVGVDHRLDAVAEVELLEDAGDVRLRR